MTKAAGEKSTAPTPETSALETSDPPAGDGLGSSVSKVDVERQIHDAMVAQGITPKEVTCDNELPGRVGAIVECTALVDGDEQKLEATVTEVKDGKAYFDVEPAY